MPRYYRHKHLLARPPMILMAEIFDGAKDTIVITFDRAVSKSSGAYKDGWSVTVGGSANTVTNGTLPSTNHINLTLTSAAAYGDAVVLTYAPGTIIDAVNSLVLAAMSMNVRNAIYAP